MQDIQKRNPPTSKEWQEASQQNSSLDYMAKAKSNNTYRTTNTGETIMKFNVEVDIDYLEDNELDEVFQKRLLNAIAAKIEKDFSAGIGETMARSAERLVSAKVELIINSVLKSP